MFEIILGTYGAVFLAEIVGDKLLYTTGVLATRYRPIPIMVGVTVAFMAKMAVAVLVGEWVSHLPPLLVAALTTVSLLGVAYTLWRKPVVHTGFDKKDAPAGAIASFTTVFLSEWGDVGQITAAAMAAKYASPMLVWVGAVAAMVTKGILAASIGAGIRRWIQNHLSPKVIRIAGVAALVVIAVLSIAEALLEGRA